MTQRRQVSPLTFRITVMESDTISWGTGTIDFVDDHVTVRDIIKKKIADPTRGDYEDPFFVADLGEIPIVLHKWKSLLPRVKPFYAIKSNDNPVLVYVLEKLGTGFDCASKGEMETVLNLGADPSRIIYANPYKQASHIKFAKNNGVQLTVFNHEGELHKIKNLFPKAKLILRIRPELGLEFPHTKFGASEQEAVRLLGVARELRLNVVGVSFHTGWHSESTSIYDCAVRLARDIFDLAPDFGFTFSILDVGGGFHGRGANFEKQAEVLSAALEKYFPEKCGTEIIAEPGQFFCTTLFTLAVNIIAKQKNGQGFMYHIGDDTFGSFHHTARMRGVPNIPRTVPNLFEPLSLRTPDVPVYPSVIWGRSLAFCDWIEKDFMLPQMNTGDWMIVKEKGEYSSCLATNFSSFQKAGFYYFVRRKHWLALKSRGVFDAENQNCTS